MTTDAGAQPDWTTVAPAAANLAVIDGLERAALGDVDGCCGALAVASVHPRWLVIVAVDLLAALGRPCPAIWNDMRKQLHERAAASAAPDELVRISLLVLALAEARDRRADLRVAELEVTSEFALHDVACAAVQLAAHVAACVWGDRLVDRLQAARKLFGGVP